MPHSYRNSGKFFVGTGGGEGRAAFVAALAERGLRRAPHFPGIDQATPGTSEPISHPSAARFLRHFDSFQGLADRKISPASHPLVADFLRTTLVLDPGSRSLWLEETVAAAASASSERGDLAGFQLGFVCLQWFAGRKSFPPSQPAPRTRRLDHGVALVPEHAGDRPASDRERAARPRGLGDQRQPRSRVRCLGSSAAGSRCGGGISCRAWPRRILVIGRRTKRVARLQIFRNKTSEVGLRMRFGSWLPEHFPLRQTTSSRRVSAGLPPTPRKLWR
jgi:hypothetical protein